MIRNDLLAFANALSSVQTKNVKFAYALAKNQAIIRPMVDALRSTLEILKPFEMERQALVQEHAARDAGGQPLVIPGGQVRLEQDRIAGFRTKMEALQKKYNADIATVDAFMKEPVEDVPKFYMVKIADLPAELENANEVISVLYPMIEE